MPLDDALLPSPATTSPAAEDLAAVTARLRAHLGDRCSTAAAVRDHHAADESALPPVRPDVVVFARTTDEVVEVVRACDEFRVPLVAGGARSSVEGHVLSVHGGVALDLTGMDEVLEVNVEDLDCRVQAG